MSHRRLIALAAALLTSCGGGDDNNSNSPGSGGDPPTNQPAPSGSGFTSTNWSGYARAGAIAQYTGITGTWTVPALRCDTGGNTNSVHWIGIGGFTTGDQTLIQAGTGADCRGTDVFYYAWWEALP